MPEGLSDEAVIERFHRRRRRQFRVFWIGFPAALAWIAMTFVTMGVLTPRHPAWNSPWVASALLLPFFVGFAAIAGRFTRANLRCPACDQPIALYGTRYYKRDFACPHCRRTLSR